jgi:hypothetical protein
MIENMRVYFIIICCFFFAFNAIYAQNNKLQNTRPSMDTMKVYVGFNLINITDINEKDETIDFDAAIYLKWNDPRLAYELDSLNFNEVSSLSPNPGEFYKTYQGDYQVKEIYSGWRPNFIIPNGIGDRSIHNMMIKIWPDGTIEYAESFNAKVETPMDLRLYPFDDQKLEVFIHPFNYDRHEIIFVPDSSMMRIWNQNMGIADWTRINTEIVERSAKLEFLNGSNSSLSELVISVYVSRKPLNVLFGIVLPMLILVCLTWVVFWMDEESVSNRVNISFIGILSVVAYYLVIQGNIPEISYITLIDAYIVLTFLILALSVVVSIIVDKTNRNNNKLLADKIDLLSRWMFPLAYFSGILVLMNLFTTLYN